MLTRRSFTALATMSVAAPFARPAQSQNASVLDSAFERLEQLHSIQVQRGDDLVYARAARGPGLDELANIKSCSKSIVALLLGTCIARGEISSHTARLADVAPALLPEDATEGAADITIENLVTLQAGLEGTSGSRYGGWIASGNWVADALRRPMIAEPGSRMIYSTGSTHILGAAMTEASGQSLLSLARQRLGDHMGFEIPPWVRDPQGYYLGGNEMALTPRAMLSLALLMRDDGTFRGTRIVPSDWIRASTISRGRSPYSGMGYGYGWFLTRSGYALARGYGGQVIAAHRDLGLAVAITSDPNRPARSGGYFGDLIDLLDNPILTFAEAA
ncbi:serine hydrolase domain-containing protein [Paracoccus saliphilus]|uniref:CubicO group peptidase, beta-lactamase class C family n=1 Tax=Paracoccus saliphilus TaxID=405559 RepID=A0AA45W3Z5_9RHOB|nr:serine hydrolase [Paracoccus saliphilus]WCR04271.1 serine hydrolase [Paracoccus saliphilus]SIS80215.1 CubicO group peptidase, beta-lactamase class C family [Paracoccus saliphilus]